MKHFTFPSCAVVVSLIFLFPLCQKALATSSSETKKTLPSILFLYGPPESGRSRIALKILHNYSLPYVSFGELIQTYSQEETILGNRIREYLDVGGDMPLTLFIDIFRKRLLTQDCLNGCLVEGAPVTLQQAEALFLAFYADFSLLACSITTDDSCLLTRMQNRFICPNCGRVYHDTFPPKKEGECDLCHVVLAKRADDTPEVLQAKLDGYRKCFMPVLNFFKEKDLLILVEGDKNLDTTYNHVVTSLSQRGTLCGVQK